MMGNFSYLLENSEYEMFAQACVDAENAIALSPTISALASRRAFELAVKWTYAADETIRMPYKDNLQSLVHEPTFRNAIGGEKLWDAFQYIIKAGNMAAHRNAKLKPEDALFSLNILFAFTQWIDYTYGRGYQRRTFDPKQVPAVKRAISAQERKRQENAARREYEAQVGEKNARIEALERRVRELSEQLAERKAAPHAVPEPVPSIDLNEYATRTRFIDLDLARVGWDMDRDIIRERPVIGMGGKPGERGFIDYVLNGRDGRPIAVIEAKRTSRDPREGLTQALEYADCLEREYGYRPLVFLSNGYQTQYVAGDHGGPRPVGEVFARADMERIMERRKTDHHPTAVPVDLNIAGKGRPYQIEAVKAICDAIEQGQRRALLVMATGTGKTRVSAALADVLMRAGLVTNVLFLADRVTLVDQAASDYGEYLPNQSLCNMCDRKRRDTTARIVFSTYQTMANAIDAETGEDGHPVFSSAHFDLIIVDEAHRSIFNKFRVIFDHFDALVVGLTATPRDEVDRNTYEFFHVENGVPTYVYEYEQALKDGVLVPYHNIEASTKFMDDGIVYDDLPDDEKRRYEEDFGEKELGLAPDGRDIGEGGEGEEDWRRDVPDHVDADALNRFVMNPSTVDAVLDDLETNGIRTAGGERLGKTVIFAVNQAHAHYIVQRFGERWPKLAAQGYIVAVVHGDDHSHSLIKDFKHKPMPVITVSVDMMDTGVDVPEIVNLVFFKKVRSKIKFLQMIGRGTRRCDGLDCVDGIDGEYVGKRRFVIFDYCSNFAYFRANPNAVDGGSIVTLSERVFARKAAIARALQSSPYADDADLREWRHALADDLHARVAELDDAAAAVRLRRAAVEPFRERPRFDAIGELDLHTLVTDVAPLVHYDESDEDALRFDALMYGLMVVRLGGDGADGAKAGAYAKRIRRSVSRLNDRMTLDPVLEQRELIARISTDDGYLAGADVKELERIRLALRSLIHYTAGEGGRRLIITDLSDPVTRRMEGEAFDMGEHYEDYRLKVNRYVNEHLDEGVIGKIHRNEPITTEDYTLLERIFVERLGTYEDYKATYADRPFGLLVRSIAKLDHAAAEAAFADFINEHPLNAQQIAFLRTVIGYVERNGYLDPRDLGKPRFARLGPFTQLFPGKLAMDLVVCITRVMHNAEAPAPGR
ncbi:DEAD/DEAH box helicase family protein [Bifidobacterium aesculapii]|uniref:DEAD/DEAH box helicase family protein n=1 Tax=Bifidobacterium aesculapii TaxID=1329411 RepID=UPI0006E1DCD9|nr:DEAD/DEAH box helicase family protein [Bifidobacterium aesculapii]